MFEKKGKNFLNFKAMVIDESGDKAEYFPICDFFGQDKKKLIKTGLKSVEKFMRKSNE